MTHIPRSAVEVFTGIPPSFQVPKDLAERDQWILWRYEQRDGKSTKLPYQTNGQAAKSNDPNTWTNYDAILTCLRKFPHWNAGPGFVFSDKDPFCGIDLDNCLDQNGTAKPWAQRIIQAFSDTYMEISPSGRGVKIWCKAKLPGTGKSKKQGGEGIEIYDQGRYFAVTGNKFNEAPLEIEEHQKEVDRLYLAVGGSPTGRPRPIGERIPHGRQHTTLVSLMGTLRARQVCDEAIEACLQLVNEHQCEKPGPRENITRMVRSSKGWKIE